MGVFNLRNREKRLCAYCGRARRIYAKAHVGVLDVLMAVATGVLVFIPISDGFDPRALGLAAVLIGFCELFVTFRHRLSLRCSACGFDPVIYRRSHEEAARLVREHSQRRAKDPAYLLAEPARPYMYKKGGAVRQKNARSKGDSLRHP